MVAKIERRGVVLTNAAPNALSSFRKPITVVPSLMGEVQTTLPGYSAKSDRQWYREPCNTSDGLGGICSVFVHARAKVSKVRGFKV